VNLFAELERMRKENAGLNSNLKSAVEQTEQARASLGRLESDLRSEKRARADAERTVAQLREQLRNIAKAIASSGVNIEKIQPGPPAAETASR
jgi:chromosome segregation ATPase